MATYALKSREGKWIMASAILASSMGFIDGTALNVALPALQESLHATATDLFWILNAYLLMIASLTLVGGSLGDKLGRKKIFIIGIIIFTIGSIACGLVNNVDLLIALRVVQGTGGALMIPGSLSIISATIDAKEKGKAIGTWSAVTTIVTMGGPILGGALADAGLWRFIFFINVPISVIALFILWKSVPESKDEDSDKTIDYAGALCIALGLALLTFGSLRIPEIGFNHASAYLALIAGMALLIAFVFVEKNSKHPMMPLSIFSNKTFSGANLLTFFLYAGLGAGLLFLSLNMVQVQGYSQLQSGLTFLPFTIIMILVSRLAGSFADKHGARLLLTVGPAIAGIGFLILSFVHQTKGPQAYFTTFLPGIAVFGLGMSLTVAPLTSTVMGSADDHFSGVASGINNAVTRISNVIANAAFGALAVIFFAAMLQTQLSHISINQSLKQKVIQQAVDLGNAAVPSGINGKEKTAIVNAYHASFIYAYTYIMYISAGLAFAGALMGFLFVRNKEIEKK